MCSRSLAREYLVTCMEAIPQSIDTYGEIWDVHENILRYALQKRDAGLIARHSDRARQT